MTGLNELSGDLVFPVGAIIETTKCELNVCQVAFHGVEVKWAVWIHGFIVGGPAGAMRKRHCPLVVVASRA
jgi:hypothetical protein